MEYEHAMLRVLGHDKFQSQLNVASANGWELVNFTERLFDGDVMFTAVFKRPNRGQASQVGL